MISRVGGESLDLTGANHCVIWEPDWNNSSTKQAIHRIYRYGQQKIIHIYKFFSEGIENLKYQKQLMKQCLSDRIIDKENSKCDYIQASRSDYYNTRMYNSESDIIDNQDQISSDSNEVLFYLKREKIYQPDQFYLVDDDYFGKVLRSVTNSEIVKETFEVGDIHNDRIPCVFEDISIRKQNQ